MKKQSYLWLLCVAFLTAASPALLQAQEKITGAVNPPNNVLTPASAGQQEYCPSDDIFTKYLNENPEARARFEESEARYRMVMGNPNLRQQVNSGAALRTNSLLCGTSSPLLTIPVVFHLVYDATGSTINIFNANEQELLDDLLTRCNLLLPNIRLVRAQRTIGNITTTGITSRQVTSSSFPINEDDGGAVELKGHNSNEYDNFPRNSYLHIWMVDGMLPSALGYATFPWWPEANQGIVLATAAIVNNQGTISAAIQTRQAGILAHELGHYLTLFHTFAHHCDVNDFCCENDDPNSDGDRVADTPPQSAQGGNCTTPPNTCHTDTPDVPDAVNNIMNYGDCLQTLTAGQITRMRAGLIFNRPDLLTSVGHIPAPTPITLPTTWIEDLSLIAVNSPMGQVCSSFIPEVEIRSTITSFAITVGYRIDGGTRVDSEPMSLAVANTPIPLVFPELTLTPGWHNIEFEIVTPASDFDIGNNKICHRFHYGTGTQTPPIPKAPTGTISPNDICFEWDPLPNAVYRIQISTIANCTATNNFTPTTGFGSCSGKTCLTCNPNSGLVVSINTGTNNYFCWNTATTGTNVCALPANGTTYFWTVRASIAGGGAGCSDLRTDYSPPVCFTTTGTAPPPSTGTTGFIATADCPQTESAIPVNNFPIATPITDAAKTLAFTNLIFGKSYTAMPTGSSAANPGFVTGNFMQTYSSGLACGSTGPCSSYSHKGLDQGVGGSIGTVSLYAPISGVVTASGGSTGKICIYNADLDATFIFLHTTNIAVSPGDDVVRGTYVGKAGSTGATASHVHSELRAGYKTAGSCQCSSAAADGVYDPRLVVDMLSVTTATPTPTPALNFPANGATNVAIPVSLGWQQVQYAEYRIQISTVNADWTPENGFGNDIRSCTGAPATLVVTVNTAQNNAFTWNDISGCFAPLPNTTYYWSVRAHTAVCGTSLYSPVRSFTTAPAAPLTVSPASMTFNATSGFGAQQTATLTGVTGPFTVTTSQSWISYNISGSNIIVYAASNTGTLSRYGTVTITSGNQTATIQVRQSGTGGCTGGTQTGGTLTPTASWQSAPSMTGGKYVVMNVTQGTQYTFSLCSTNAGVAAYDSEITILDHLTPTFQHAFNQTGTFGCGDDAKLTWTSPVTGTIRVLVHQNHCISNALATTLRYKTGTGKWDDETVVPNAPSLSLYPNPASTMVSLNFTTLAEAEEVLITLYDASGKAVFVEKNIALLGSNTFVLETAGFNPGVYMVTVQNTAGILTDKLVLIK